MAAVRGLGSLLAIDNWGRQCRIRQLFGVEAFANSRYQHTAISDSQLRERLDQLDSNAVRQLHYSVLKQTVHHRLVQPIAVLDGSVQGGLYYNTLGFLTRWGDVLVVDVEPYGSRGRELSAGGRLLRRASEQLGGGWIRYLLVDALYMNSTVYEWRQRGWVGDLVIKYTPADGAIGQARRYRLMLDAFERVVEQCRQQPRDRRVQRLIRTMGFAYEEGYDSGQGIGYRLWSCRNNSYDNRFKIVRVEEYRGGRLLQRYYVLSTDKALSAQQMRCFARQRWAIENDGFRQLSQHVDSKHYGLKALVASCNRLLIQFLAVSLLMLFRREWGYNIHKRYHTRKITLRFVAQLLFEQPYLGKHWLPSV